MTSALPRILCSVLLLLSAPALADSVIVGTVLSAETKKPLPDVVVTARSPNLQGEQTTVTDSQGQYRIPQLPPGVYTLRFDKEAFKPFTRSEVQLRLDRTIRVNVELLPEGFTPEMVDALPPTINIGSTSSGAAIDQDFIKHIAVNRHDRIFATGEPVTREEYEASLKVGDTLEQAYFSFNAQPIRDALGAVDAIMVVVVNVTEQVRARRALEAATREREQLLVREQEARREAEMANRAKDDFLAMLGDIGIAPNVLPRVFDLFAQERQALDRSLGGLGLGLAIVRSLVTMHGGMVSVTSEGRGRGSEFVLRLPLIPSIQSPDAEVVGEEPARKASLPAGLKILVVDDNQDAADVLAEALGLLGHETRVAHRP